MSEPRLLDLATESQRYRPGDKVARRAQDPGTHWERHLSQSMSVHPLDVECYNQHLKRSGVTNAEYRPDGRLEIRSRNGNFQVAKALSKFVNNDIR